MTDLQEMFVLTNINCFGSGLKNITIRWAKPGELDKGVVALTQSTRGKVPKEDRKFLILFSRKIRQYTAFTWMTLIHELVHCEQWDEVTNRSCHGKKFQSRMKELAAIDAFEGLW